MAAKTDAAIERNDSSSKIKILIRDEHPGSYFRGRRNNFLRSKKLKFYDADPEPKYGIFLTLEPGSGMEIRIRDPE